MKWLMSAIVTAAGLSACASPEMSAPSPGTAVSCMTGLVTVVSGHQGSQRTAKQCAKALMQMSKSKSGKDWKP